MSTTATPARRKTKGDSPSYWRLLKQWPLRVIENRSDYAAVAKILDSLVVREGSLDAGEQMYLDALELFIEQYDDRHVTIPADKRTPGERLKYLMEQSGMDRARLIGLLEVSRPLASMILSGRRELSKANIRKLSDHFKVSTDYFL